MLGSEKPARKRTPRLHIDPATGATVHDAKRPAAKQPAAKPAPKESKAALVRALLDEGKTVKEIASALKDKGVTWSYAWDARFVRLKAAGACPPRCRRPIGK